MKYLSLDIETTGLNPLVHDVLELGAIVEDTKLKLPRSECPTFHTYFWKENYVGEPIALAMNAHILRKIHELKKAGDMTFLADDYTFGIRFAAFLRRHFGSEAIVPAGKNVTSFDLPFLRRFKYGWSDIRFRHRALDPTLKYVNWETDTQPPDLSTCKKRAGLPELVTHEALDDSWDVISLLRTEY
jgi:oligoribonuclease (3'-5' exoribonuclease)